MEEDDAARFGGFYYSGLQCTSPLCPFSVSVNRKGNQLRMTQISPYKPAQITEKQHNLLARESRWRPPTYRRRWNGTPPVGLTVLSHRSITLYSTQLFFCTFFYSLTPFHGCSIIICLLPIRYIRCQLSLFQHSFTHTHVHTHAQLNLIFNILHFICYPRLTFGLIGTACIVYSA